MKNCYPWPIFILLLHPHFKTDRYLTEKKKKKKEDDFPLFKIHDCKIVLHDYWLNSFHFPLIQKLTQKYKNQQVSLVLGSPAFSHSYYQIPQKIWKKNHHLFRNAVIEIRMHWAKKGKLFSVTYSFQGQKIASEILNKELIPGKYSQIVPRLTERHHIPPLPASTLWLQRCLWVWKNTV